MSNVKSLIAACINCYKENDVLIIGIGDDDYAPKNFIIIGRFDEDELPVNECIGFQRTNQLGVRDVEPRSDSRLY